MADLHENTMGEAKGTTLEDAVDANFRGETAEIGLYLAMAIRAQAEGYAEVADVLKTIANEEAGHAARFALLNGKISANTKDNIEKMIAGEKGANKAKMESAVKAQTEAGAETAELFAEASRDEARHARMLEGLLKRYF